MTKSPWVDKESGASSDAPNHKSICSPWLQNKTITASPWRPATASNVRMRHGLWHHSHLDARLANNTPSSPLSTSGNPRGLRFLSVCLSLCLSTPALRDEREEPVAHASDHHHHCDWRHSDCCPGDGSSFAEQARPPKAQGMAEWKYSNVVACSLHGSQMYFIRISVQRPQAKYSFLPIWPQPVILVSEMHLQIWPGVVDKESKSPLLFVVNACPD